jgi:hypothetical protein
MRRFAAQKLHYGTSRGVDTFTADKMTWKWG